MNARNPKWWIRTQARKQHSQHFSQNENRKEDDREFTIRTWKPRIWQVPLIKHMWNYSRWPTSGWLATSSTTSTRPTAAPSSPSSGRRQRSSTTLGSPPSRTSGPSESSAGRSVSSFVLFEKSHQTWFQFGCPSMIWFETSIWVSFYTMLPSTHRCSPAATCPTAGPRTRRSWRGCSGGRSYRSRAPAPTKSTRSVTLMSKISFRIIPLFMFHCIVHILNE